MDKITEQDLANRGVKGLPDVPGLTTEEMQRKLEEIAREILIPKVNELVEGLNNANSNLSRDRLGEEIEITSNYTFPDDGYLRLFAPYGGTAFVTVSINSTPFSAFSNANCSANSVLFVKKGMNCIVTESKEGSRVMFRRLI